MSRDLFSRYTQLYQKSRAREIIPEGPFVRQLTDVPRLGLDVSVFFKAKRVKNPRQVYLGRPIPIEVAKRTGFLETSDNTFFSRDLITNMKGLQYLRVVIAAGRHLTEIPERVQFLKQCQRIIDVIARKARNVAHQGDFEAFRFDKKIYTLEEYLKKHTKLDEVGIEAASISFIEARPDYIYMPDGEIIVFNNDYSVPHGVYYFAGGIGYSFDRQEGAATEERVFRAATDLSSFGIDDAYLESMMLRVTEDFQTRVHSVIFADVWKKAGKRPIGVNFRKNLFIKAEPSSEIWLGIFEIYLASPKA